MCLWVGMHLDAMPSMQAFHALLIAKDWYVLSHLFVGRHHNTNTSSLNPKPWDLWRENGKMKPFSSTNKRKSTLQAHFSKSWEFSWRWLTSSKEALTTTWHGVVGGESNKSYVAPWPHRTVVLPGAVDWNCFTSVPTLPLLVTPETASGPHKTVSRSCYDLKTVRIQPWR